MFVVNPGTSSPHREQEAETASAAVCEALDQQTVLPVDVATGGSPIRAVNDAYIADRRGLDTLMRSLGSTWRPPFDNLWRRRGHWIERGLDSYDARRQRVVEQTGPIRRALEMLSNGVLNPGDPAQPSWARVDARLRAVHDELAAATGRDDYQDVGSRSREVLIDTACLLVAQAPVPAGERPPRATDAMAWLDLYLRAHIAGRGHEQLRALISRAWHLAQRVTHDGIQRVVASAAAQVTVVVRVMQQVGS